MGTAKLNRLDLSNILMLHLHPMLESPSLSRVFQTAHSEAVGMSLVAVMETGAHMFLCVYVMRDLNRMGMPVIVSTYILLDVALYT